MTTTLTPARVKPTPQCVLRFDDRPADEYLDDADIPMLSVSGFPIVARRRWTVNVHPEKSKVTATANELLVMRRASGKVFSYWSAAYCVTICRTKNGLILARSRSATAIPTPVYIFTARELSMLVGHLVSESGSAANNYRRRLHRAVAKAVATTCGDWQDPDQLFPLLSSLAEDMGGKVSVTDLIKNCPSTVRNALCGAPSWAEVVRKLFGSTRYRRPLLRSVTALLEPRAGVNDPLKTFTSWCWWLDHLWTYRGLVPIDWIIDSINTLHDAHTTPGVYFLSRERRTIRSVLRQLPQPVLRRVLAETLANPVMARRCWRDISSISSDVSGLAEAVALRRQRNIRGIRDVEQLVLQLPQPTRSKPSRSSAASNVLKTERNDERRRARFNDMFPDQSRTREQWVADRDQYVAAMNEVLDLQEQEAKEKSRQRDALIRQWVQDHTSIIDGATLPGGHRIVLAKDAATLSRWGISMGHCIGAYSRYLDTSLLGAVVRTDGTLAANFHIVYDSSSNTGILDQIFGRFNQELKHDSDQEVIDGMRQLCEANNISISPLGQQGLAA